MSWILHKSDEEIELCGRRTSQVDPEDEPEVVMEDAIIEAQSQAEPEAETPQATEPTTMRLEAVLDLARSGRKEILPMLRQVLDKHPELWQHFGNLALQTQESWLLLISGKDLYLAESLRLHLDTMRKEMAGPSPSPLDRLLVDRILACHVQSLYFDAMETTDPTAENMRVARYRMARRDQAHRHFLSAVKMLATVRNLVARTNVIQIELLNPPMVHAPAAPIVPMANGEQPQSRNGHTNKTRNGSKTKTAGPVNRVSGAMSGQRNRFADVLEPTTAE
jgi:hypothetical protein